MVVSVQFSQFSCSVVSDSLRPHESQHTRPSCPSPTPGVHSDSHPYMTTCTKLLLLLLLLSRFSRVRLHATPRWQTTRLTPSLGFSRQEHWSGFPLPSPGTKFSSVQFSSVAQSCLTLCDPMNHSTPGLPVHHQPLEFTQTHVH